MGAEMRALYARVDSAKMPLKHSTLQLAARCRLASKSALFPSFPKVSFVQGNRP